MLYQGSDGRVHVLGDGEELKHWKYIKKIKTGNGWRYFYTPEEVQAYYEEQKKSANKNYKKDLKKMESEHKMLMKPTPFNSKLENKRNQAIENHRYAHEKTKAKIEKTVKPIAKTAKAAKEGKIPKKAKLVDDKKKKDRINKGKSAVEKKLNKAKKTVKNEAKGVKRASDAIRGKGDNFYDGGGAKKYRKYKYDKKKGYYTQRGKAKKTGKIERRMINAYRKTHPYE